MKLKGNRLKLPKPIKVTMHDRVQLLLKGIQRSFYILSFHGRLIMISPIFSLPSLRLPNYAFYSTPSPFILFLLLSFYFISFFISPISFISYHLIRLSLSSNIINRKEKRRSNERSWSNPFVLAELSGLGQYSWISR